MSDWRGVDELQKKYDELLKERNEMALEITNLQMALSPLALIADEVIEQKSIGWLKHWEALPVHMLHKEDGQFTMPTLAQCLRAKKYAEGDYS